MQRRRAMPMRKRQIQFQRPCTLTYWSGRCRKETYFCGPLLSSSGTAWEGQSVSTLLLCTTFVVGNLTLLQQDMIRQSQTRRENLSMKRIYMPIRSGLLSVRYWLLVFGVCSFPTLVKWQSRPHRTLFCLCGKSGHSSSLVRSQ